MHGRRSAAAAAAALLLLLPLSGCGPGFPIMTAEQESHLTSIETVKAENEALKKRVASLEKGGGSDSLRKELDAVKARVADATIGLDQIRQEFSFIRGNIEESEYERAQIKEDIKFSGEGFRSLNDRLASIDASLSSAGKRLEAISLSVDSNSKAVSDMKATVASLQERVKTLEARASGPAPAKAEARQEPSSPAKPDPDELYRKGYELVREKKYAEASETFQAFLKEHPRHKLSDHAQYWMGEIYYATGDYAKAILEFDKVVKNYPDGGKVPAAMLKEGYSFEKLDMLKEARVLLEQLAAKYPGTDEAALAKKRLETLGKKKASE